MTPKVKAEELINKFLTVGYLFRDAKNCALILVNEMIEESNPDKGFYFWQCVKQEIEKL